MVKQVASLGDLKQELADAGEKLVVIDFYATWCGPCKIIAPKLEEMSGEMENVVFLKVDVDENEEAAQEYNISAMPTFIFIKNQEKVADLMGANVDKLKELVNQHAWTLENLSSFLNEAFTRFLFAMGSQVWSIFNQMHYYTK